MVYIKMAGYVLQYVLLRLSACQSVLRQVEKNYCNLVLRQGSAMLGNSIGINIAQECDIFSHFYFSRRSIIASNSIGFKGSTDNLLEYFWDTNFISYCN